MFIVARKNLIESLLSVYNEEQDRYILIHRINGEVRLLFWAGNFKVINHHISKSHWEDSRLDNIFFILSMDGGCPALVL